MARDAKVIRVTLQAIKCISAGSDPGANLEIFGRLEARGVFIDPMGDPQAGFRQILWSADDGINIAPGTELPVNTSAQFFVFERDFLWIGGLMVEEDDFTDDVLADGFRKVPFDNIGDEIISVGFRSDGQEVVPRFRIEVLEIKKDLAP